MTRNVARLTLNNCNCCSPISISSDDIGEGPVHKKPIPVGRTRGFNVCTCSIKPEVFEGKTALGLFDQEFRRSPVLHFGLPVPEFSV